MINNGKEFNMNLFNGGLSDGDYKIVIKGSDIGGGTHEYHFWFYDGHDGVKFPIPDDGFIVNYQPNKPTLTGPSNGVPNEEYTFYAETTDNDGDDIKYWFDWGDGTTTKWLPENSWVASGITVEAKHTWDKKGTYHVKVKAKDKNNDESKWSELTIKVPINKLRTIYQLLLQNLIKQFLRFLN